jgi:rod shape-determining protein MreD
VERVLRLLGLCGAALAAQAAVVTLSPIRDPLPDLVVIAILFAAASDIAVPWGAALALVVGYLFDLLSGSPVGLHSLVFELVFLLGRSIQRRFFLAGVLFEVTMAVGAVWLVAAVVVAVRILGQEREVGDLGGVAVLTLIRSVLTAVFAPAVFWLGNRMTAAKKPTMAARPLEPRSGAVE